MSESPFTDGQRVGITEHATARGRLPQDACEGAGMTDLDNCACGHIRYHHRPECTHRPTMLRNEPRDCDCAGFEKEQG